MGPISTRSTSTTSTTSTTTTTTTTTTSTPKDNIRRDKPRSQCPSSYCSEGSMLAQCWPGGNCRSLGGKLSNKWFSIGTTSYTANSGRGQRYITSYYHPRNSDMDCLPCCMIRSNHSKMPSKNSLIVSHILTGHLRMYWCSVCWRLVWMVCGKWSLWRRFLSWHDQLTFQFQACRQRRFFRSNNFWNKIRVY